MTATQIPVVSASMTFLEYVEGWMERLTPVPLDEVIREAAGPEHVGIFCVDVINGFCHEGALQSDRVQAIVAPIANLMRRAGELGVRTFVLPQDAHPADSVEFSDFPPHCVAGTAESETVPELTALSESRAFQVIPKRSISSAVRTGLPQWVDQHLEITHRVVVGDCTDLCTYQLAMYMKTEANARNVAAPVIVPADCVDTYDLPVDVARDLGILPHPGDFFHAIFLYHMALNGIRVVTSIA